MVHPDPQIGTGSPIESQKGGKITTIEKEKDAPQPSCALQEFVKYIADPLVDKGWNLHLKFGKGESQKEKFVQGSSPQKPTSKTVKKERVSKPQIEKQIPLEMATGGDGGGKKGGSGGKRPPEDKVEIEDYLNKGEEEDSSSETSFELEVDPQQLALAGLNRPLLRLRLTPRRKVVVAAPGGGRTPPLGGRTKTIPLQERPNGRRPDQPVKGGGDPPQPLNGGGGGIGPPFIERGGRMPQQPAGGGGAPPPGGDGGGNGNGDENGGAIDHLPQGEMEEEVEMMMVMMEMVVEEMFHHHHQIKDNHNAAKIREIDGYMWYKGCLDLQANQARMEGMAKMDKYLNYPEE